MNSPFIRKSPISAAQFLYIIKGMISGSSEECGERKASSVGARYPVDVENLTAGRMVSSIEAAEDIILAHIDETVCPVPMLGRRPEVQVLDASCMIASKSRRSVGNVVLAHPSFINHIREGSSVFDKKVGEGENVGRWEFVGKLGDFLMVYASPHMPEDRVYVTYLGSAPFDCAVQVFEDAEGLKLATIDEIESSLKSVSDYFEVVLL